MRSTLVAVFIVLLAAGAAKAGIVLDQVHDNTGSGTANSTNGDVTELGQTFTVGVAGTLDHIDVLMFYLTGNGFDPTGPASLSVYNTSSGLPTGSPLATTTVPKTSVPLGNPGFVSFDVSGAAIPLNIGEVLAFGVSSPDSAVGPYFVEYDEDTGDADDYLAGGAYYRFPPGAWQTFATAEDHGFRTFVNTIALPEPASWILAVLGMSSLVCWAWMRKPHPSRPLA